MNERELKHRKADIERQFLNDMSWLGLPITESWARVNGFQFSPAHNSKWFDEFGWVDMEYQNAINVTYRDPVAGLIHIKPAHILYSNGEWEYRPGGWHITVFKVGRGWRKQEERQEAFRRLLDRCIATGRVKAKNNSLSAYPDYFEEEEPLSARHSTYGRIV